MLKVQRLLLASSSPFRKKLLVSTGIEFSTLTSEVDEYKLVGADPAETCGLRAAAKALAVAALAPDALVIGCDQILELAGRSFDKAKSAGEAAARLQEFSGKTHRLINQIVIANHNHSDRVIAALTITVPMTMRSLTPEEIEAYVATGEWQGCVGCYQFENRGIHLFEQTPEDHSAIVGLPLQPLLKELRRLGINPLLQPKGPWTITRD